MTQIVMLDKLHLFFSNGNIHPKATLINIAQAPFFALRFAELFSTLDVQYFHPAAGAPVTRACHSVSYSPLRQPSCTATPGGGPTQPQVIHRPSVPGSTTLLEPASCRATPYTNPQRDCDKPICRTGADPRVASRSFSSVTKHRYIHTYAYEQMM